MIRTALLIFLLPVASFAQLYTGRNPFSVRQFLPNLIAAKKVNGYLYDSSRVVLNLTENGKAGDYLVDSVASFCFLNKNKVSFVCYFNDVATDIKLGYVEINFSPYRTKLLLLNDLLINQKTIKKKDARVTYLYTKSHLRYNSSTFLKYKIISRFHSASLFSSTVRSSVVTY